MVEDPFDEILSLVSQAKSDLYRDVGWADKAARETVQAARYQLDAALASAKQGNYREALHLLRALQKILQENNLLASEWAEIYVAQAICHARLGEKREMKAAWRKASELEPDNDKLKEIAKGRGLL